MTVVNLRPNESQEQLFKRFKKKVMKSGLMTVLRNKRWFVSKSETRRMDEKKRSAACAANAARWMIEQNAPHFEGRFLFDGTGFRPIPFFNHECHESHFATLKGDYVGE